MQFTMRMKEKHRCLSRNTPTLAFLLVIDVFVVLVLSLTWCGQHPHFPPYYNGGEASHALH